MLHNWAHSRNIYLSFVFESFPFWPKGLDSKGFPDFQHLLPWDLLPFPEETASSSSLIKSLRLLSDFYRKILRRTRVTWYLENGQELKIHHRFVLCSMETETVKVQNATVTFSKHCLPFSPIQFNPNTTRVDDNSTQLPLMDDKELQRTLKMNLCSLAQGKAPVFPMSSLASVPAFCWCGTQESEKVGRVIECGHMRVH